MSGFFKKKSSMNPFIFKSNEAAFEIACKYMDTSIKAGKTSIALVDHCTQRDDGLQNLKVRIPSADGGVEIPHCTTLNKDVPHIAVGDLVGFYIAENNSSLMGDLGIIGFVTCKMPCSKMEKVGR